MKRPCALSASLVLLSLLLGALRAGPLQAAPEDEALWLRAPAIAPDGQRIAFSYRGDIWLVGRAGGRAVPLTTHAAHETHPVWSPDGRLIAFASDRHGNADVFVVAAQGGKERRLTFHASDEVPTAFTADGTAVLFSARRQDAPEALLGSGFLTELWQVPAEGGVPTQVLTTPAEGARPNGDGTLLVYEDLKAYENEWRKHHVSSAARDLWLYDARAGTHRRLTSNPGEDRDPLFAPDGKTILYLAERGGSFNVFAMPLEGDATARALTAHEGEPVRSLSGASDGTLCYAQAGGLWVKPPDGPPVRLRVTAPAGARENEARREVLTDDATELAVNPKGDTVAFVVRGEVFVASAEHGTTRRVTDTPWQERDVAWGPDGKTLYYAAERDGSWDLQAATLAHPEEERFFRATGFVERAVLATEAVEFQPTPSPDGKWLAYVHDRDAIRLLDLETGTTRPLVPDTMIYSYADGDVELCWSPDSRWLAFGCTEQGRWIGAIALADVQTGSIVNVTRSGYDEHTPRFSPDGRTLLFQSNRHGRRNHASWGSEDDVLALHLTRAARERARLDEEEYELLVARERKEKRKARQGKEGPDGDGGGKGGERDGPRKDGDADEEEDEEEDREPPLPVQVELDRLVERVDRLTPHSLPLGPFALSKDGETLLYTGRAGNAWHLWAHRARKDLTRRLATLGERPPRDLALTPSGKKLFVLDGKGTILRFDVGAVVGREPPERGLEPERVAYRAEMVVRGPQERAYVFGHVVDQVRRKFYDPALHGVDWPALADTYRAYLPFVTEGPDFAELLSEMLGELNASHTGARWRPERGDDADRTASLGLLFDVGRGGEGAAVAEVLADGPADRPDTKLGPGAVLTHVDGEAVGPAAPLEALLNRKEGKRVRLRFTPPGGGEAVEEVLRAISQGEERELLYERWVRRCRALAARLSEGRVGYVHVRGMDDDSFRRVYRDALGLHGTAQALVVDTRFNGGGWIHDDLVAFLGGRDYVWFVPRGKEKGALGAEPHNRWSRPVAVLQNEANYSDAHMFPFAFQHLGLGRLVGMPVAGTGTAVWWERQIDPALVFGIPQVGMMTADGRYLENTELVPDVRVEQDPARVARGEDPQLEAAVRLLLEEVAKGR